MQYLAPIIKNRQYNFPPLGVNPFVGATARPNEVTYSEDWMRPDYVPPQPPPATAAADADRPRRTAGRRWPPSVRRPIPTDGLPGHDGAAGRRLMMTAPRRRALIAVLPSRWLWRVSGCGTGGG